jgi:hypothetical protein
MAQQPSQKYIRARAHCGGADHNNTSLLQAAKSSAFFAGNSPSVRMFF